MKLKWIGGQGRRAQWYGGAGGGWGVELWVPGHLLKPTEYKY